MLKIERRGKKGIFQIIGTLRGIRVHESTRTASEPHAEALRIQLEKRILDEDVYGKRATAVFSEAVVAYLEGGGSPRFVGPLNRHFGPWRMSDVTQGEVLKFARKQYPGTSGDTIDRQVFTPLIAIWRVAHEAQLCGPHEFRRPRKAERLPVAYAKDDFVAQLLPACSPRLKAAVLLITFSGARASECCNLSDDDGDVDWERRTALLRRTKNGRPRTVVLPDMVYKAMLPLKGRKGPLFGLRTRHSLNQALARACERAGLPVMTSHKVGRHAFAARHLKRGRTLKELQEAGGWSPKSLPMLAEIYGHMEQSHIDEMVRESDRELTQILRKRARAKLQVIDGRKKKRA
jgi:integrase